MIDLPDRLVSVGAESVAAGAAVLGTVRCVFDKFIRAGKIGITAMIAAIQHVISVRAAIPDLPFAAV